MKTFLTFCFILISFNFLTAQDGVVFYQVEPIPLGATEFTVLFEVNAPEPPEGFACGFGILFLQTIDRESVNDPFVQGEDIMEVFIDACTSDSVYSYTRTFNLPAGMSFQENLPNNKVYRLIDQFNSGLPLFNDSTNEDAGYLSLFDYLAEQEIIIGGSSRFSNITLSFIDRITTIEDFTNNFTIKTSVEANISEFDFTSVKFQIHIVDDANIFEMDDVTPQELVSESDYKDISQGNSNIDFTLATPTVLSENLPAGKSYRVRLVNDEFNSENAFPFPYKLTVVAEGLLSIPEIIDEKQLVSVYPNPSSNFIEVSGLTNVESYKIFDISGTFIKEVPVSDQLIISNLTSGMYILTTKDNIFISRFIKK